MAETGVCDPLLKASVLRENQQSFTVGIQPAGRVNIRDIDPVGQRTPATAGFSGELTENSERFVQQQG